MRISVFVIAAVLTVPSFFAQKAAKKGGEDESGPYQVVEGWPQPFARTGYVQGSQSGVFAESPNRIFLGNRGELKLPEKLPATFNGTWGSLGQRATEPQAEIRNCILVVDANGKLLESWTQHDHLFQGGRGPHKIRISPYDPQRAVWVVDDQRHQILKFSNDGKKLLMTLGEPGVRGEDEKHFGRPIDIAWFPDGSFLVSDGYINTRIVKFDANGKYIMAWGSKGTGPGQFNLPHAVAVDRKRRVYVADRFNHRIQIFAENGKYLDEWPGFRQALDLLITPDQHLWVSDEATSKFLKYDLNGKLLASWGTYGVFPGAFWSPHQFSVDSDGNLYVAEAYGGRTQKFRPAPNADRSRLISPPLSSYLR